MLKTQFKDGRSEPVLLAALGKTIGRGIINDIVMDENGVSGFHADLTVEGEQVTGPEKGQLIPINQSTIIGRALECDILILESELFRKHAEIGPLNDQLIIRDLGSANGSYVNAKKIDEVSLKDRDTQQFNKFSFIVKAP